MMRDRLTTGLGLVTLLLLLVGFTLAFVVPPDVNQGSLVRLMFVHVPSAWLSYLAYGGTGLFGLLYLITRGRSFDRLSMASAEIGLVFTVSTLVGGMLWAKPTWGTYWVWEPRLTTTALSLLIYGGYLLVRGMIEEPERRARVAAVIGVAGTLYVPVNYMSVYWWRSIHQTPTLNLLGKVQFKAAPIYGVELLIMTVAFTLLYVYLLRVRGTLARLAEEREERAFDLEVRHG
ncbi:cytochrome c biogenesis protein CcsA [Deinococcus maricopensis]|uniref:Heme exporter protein C n=1 Tax=Deinococcus maricopensis (strain DSM 21211 / LMG 22137 / NRRL B-23946 / LB-34) TaxID=709986 RepID=E8U6W5_DEIML|nr:cytochrome c biogenesis protein CcsA [Deinococcus maricopensis]ADV66804.1 cytochrome c assembly protein [Deinococcus maricopensis DSM 21211]